MAVRPVEVVLKLSPLQARLVGEVADEKAQEAQRRGYRNDRIDWRCIASAAHLAADRGFGRR